MVQSQKAYFFKGDILQLQGIVLSAVLFSDSKYPSATTITDAI